MNLQTVASPAQVRAILAEVARLRPELTAFFGCLYYAALRPEEAVALRRANLVLSWHGRDKLFLTGACPRTGSAWTSTSTPHEPRGLKHRPDGTVRVVPVPPVLVGLLWQHLREYGSAPDGPLFRGGILSESTYSCAWHDTRDIALGPNWPSRRSPAAPTTCAMPPCRYGWTPPARPPRLLHAPGPAPGSCTTSTCTAPTASKTTLASGSKTLSMLTPVINRRHSGIKASGYTNRRLHPRTLSAICP